MNIGMYINYFLICALLVVSFFDISNSFILIPCIVFAVFCIQILNTKRTLTKIWKNKDVRKFQFEDYVVYIINDTFMGNHNVAVIGFRTPNIFIEEQVVNHLSEESIKAVLMHEIGHIKQKNRQILYILKYLSVALTAIGFHNIMYEKLEIVYPIWIIGMLFMIIIHLFEKKNEYAADAYALAHGVKKQDLIQALFMINEMNEKNKCDDMIHPVLEKRIKKINLVQ